MSDSQFAQLLELLKQIGSVAQVTGIATYEAAMRQAIIIGIFQIAAVLIAVMFAVLLWKFTIGLSDTPEDKALVRFWVTFIYMFFAILLLIVLSAGVSNILNPQWAAIDLLKGLVNK